MSSNVPVTLTVQSLNERTTFLSHLDRVCLDSQIIRQTSWTEAKKLGFNLEKYIEAVDNKQDKAEVVYRLDEEQNIKN